MIDVAPTAIANMPTTRCQSSETTPFQCQIVLSGMVTVTSALKPFSEPLPPVLARSQLLVNSWIAAF